MAEQHEDTLRETLAASFEASESPAEPAKVNEPDAPATETPASTDPNEGKEPSAPIVEPEAKSQTKETKEPGKAEPVKPSAEDQPKPAEEIRSRRAPGTWRPAAREKWAALPPDVQSEILRREAEVARGLHGATESRRFHEEFNKTVAPYQNLITAEGGNPLAMVNNLMTTAATMYYGTPAQKVNMVAGFIKNFGVDLALLDNVLASDKPLPGNGPAAGNTDVRQLIQNEVRNSLSPLFREYRQNEQVTQERVAKELEEFAANPDNEFFDDVRDTMADLLEKAAQQGRQMDLSTAYKRATMMHPDIAEIIEDRNLRRRAAEVSAAAEAAKKKSVSVVGAPGKSASGEARPETLRGDLEAAIEQLSN